MNIASRLLMAVALLLCGVASADERVLRVCADPNNLPFSNRAGEGFENILAQWIAHDLHARVDTTWWAQRRGFVKQTLAEHQCDVVMGVPAGYALVTTTRPYYRSGFVLVSPAERALHLASLDDPRLKTLKLGIHIAGPEQLSPPAIALARRGIVDNVVGYRIYGDYSTPNPPLALVDAVARGDIDAAILWGPPGGYGALHSSRKLALQLLPEDTRGSPEFSYAIALGVRKGDHALADELDHALERLQPRINALLTAYGIPQMPLPSQRPSP